MFTAILASVLCVLSLGIGRHVARHFGIYLMLGIASLLPIFIYLSIPAIAEQSPVSYFFMSLLGDKQAANANIHLLAITAGFITGLLWQMLHKSDDRR